MPSQTETTSPALVDVFVARQPIFDIGGKVVAYELLYRRNGAIAFADGDAAGVMASEVLVHTFLNIGIDRVTAGVPAFLNFTREMLLHGVYQLFNPKEVVIELLESVQPDAEVVAACTAMTRAGYTLALDDFVFDPGYEALLPLARIVKLDVLDRDPADLAALIERLAPWKVQLLAERVETADVRDACQSLGCTLFQGYFFSRPQLLANRDLSASQLTILRLMNLLRDVDSSDVKIEEAFRTDISLTYKLLRAVNSAAIGGRGIESILHAVRLVGRAEMHKWLALLLVTSVAGKGGLTEEAVHTAIRRARMCELVAIDRGDKRGAEALFMVGLFSMLDAILGAPLAELLDRIDLATEVRRALLVRSGPFAPTLGLIEAYERGAWDVVNGEADLLGIPAQSVADLYLSALHWARDQVGSAAQG
ncbi:MAG: Cyclic di-GMP phosphodiesterase CdgJ [Gemmatimonadaceae bacterium]|nr:Cyclic di-GMP phosphodiesterase CdgJ [Gemmatimonadaceae bacterium]